MARPRKNVEAEAPIAGVDGIGEDQIGEFVEPESTIPDGTDDMNDLAARIFEGQSPDLPLNERVRRIKNAVIERGWGGLLPLLIIPAKGFERYL
ncbi:MAG: hypothetical protein WC047_00580 [Kiritimatiellales bacterium]